MNTETLDIIRKAPVFSQLDDRTLRVFVVDCRVVPFKAGTQILRPSQPADRFFLVLSGQVRIYKLSPRGETQILHLYGPGETFGEAAMLAGVEFPAHAEAVEDSRLLVVPRDTLRRALADNAELALGMLAGLSAKLREFNLLIEQLSLMEVPARLAGVLLEMARKAQAAQDSFTSPSKGEVAPKASFTSPSKGEVAPKGRVRVNPPATPDRPISFRLPQTKRELASQIGTIPETLSRALAKLKSQGLIEVKGSHIRLKDIEGLRELAENG